MATAPSSPPGGQDFDPGAAARPESGLFGLDVEPGSARVQVIPVPWDATASYMKGAHRAPEAILRASHQIDLFDLDNGRPYEAGIALLETEPAIVAANAEASVRADRVLAVAGDIAGDAGLAADLARVNELGRTVNEHVRARTRSALEAGVLPVVLGGDHSVPLGAFQAAGEHLEGFGILHLDAHADLRPAYEGFTWSHASIFHNALEQSAVTRLVQFGIRDLCEAEHDLIRTSGGRIRTVFDSHWMHALRAGQGTQALVRDALADLPRNVWLSIDIDGLSPDLCPNTGTPVPGGLSWHDALSILEGLVASGRRVVGCDLCEVSPGADPQDAERDSWDAVVGARLLYKMIGCALRTRGGS